MSQENVEVRNKAVRRFFAAFEDEDDAFRAVLHPEIEWYPIEENRTPTRGVDAALWNRNQWLDTWDDYQQDVEEVIEDGDDVVARVHIKARGQGSGVEADVRFFAQFKVRDGKVAYIYDHDDRAAALEAAGLREQAMSKENVEIAWRACEAAWRRPKPDFDTLNALAHPDHEMFTVQSLVEGGGYRGAQGFREWLASWGEMFGEDWEASVTEARPVDDERVLVTGWMKARGVRGGVPVEQEFWVVMRVHDGRVIRSAVHTDREQALEAAGLRE